MKTLLVAVSMACLLAAIGVFGAETYPEEYNNLPVKELLANETARQIIVKCLLEDECTDRGREIKGYLFDAWNTKCAKCTEAQKGHIRDAVEFFKEKLPEEWGKIVMTVDPNRASAEEFKKFLAGGEQTAK